MQVEQLWAPAELYLFAAPHTEHEEEPLTAEYPASHRVGSEEPSHVLPLGHSWHLVREFSPPPSLVNDP